jgi:hypothetical protein
MCLSAFFNSVILLSGHLSPFNPSKHQLHYLKTNSSFQPLFRINEKNYYLLLRIFTEFQVYTAYYRLIHRRKMYAIWQNPQVSFLLLI